MKQHRHADNVGTNILCLQGGKETLADFIERCNLLRKDQGEEQVTVTMNKCTECSGFGEITNNMRRYKCLACEGTGFK